VHEPPVKTISPAVRASFGSERSPAKKVPHGCLRGRGISRDLLPRNMDGRSRGRTEKPICQFSFVASARSHWGAADFKE